MKTFTVMQWKDVPDIYNFDQPNYNLQGYENLYETMKDLIDTLKFVALVFGTSVCSITALILIVGVLFFRVSPKEILYLIPAIVSGFIAYKLFQLAESLANE